MPDAPDRRTTVVVVAYGAVAQLRRCLDALGGSAPVVVVDNSSSSAVAAVAGEAGADYRDPGANLGFAAAVNRALADVDLAAGDVLLLNPDAALDPAALGLLERALHEAPDIACVAPAQRHPGSGAAVQVCWPFATPARAWAEAVGLGRRRQGWDFLIGSVLLVRGEALLDVGGFDEGFFLYGEEADWQRRALKRGWRVRYCAEATALHEGSGTDTDAGGHQLRFHAGVERHVRKWHGPVGWRSYQLASVLTALRRNLRGSPEHRRASLRLAGLYLRGPYARALRQGAVPPTEHRVPTFDRTAAGGA